MSHRTFTSLLIDLVQKGARLTDAELAHLRKKAVDGCQSLFANTLDDNQLQRSTLQAWDRLLRQLGDKSSTIRAAYEEAKEAVETHRLEADREYAADHEADAESSSVNTLRSSSPIQPEDDIVVEVDLSEAMTMPLSRPASSQSSPSPSEMSSAGSLRSDEESGSENEETTV
jgi:hypothetical protein